MAFGQRQNNNNFYYLTIKGVKKEAERTYIEVYDGSTKMKSECEFVKGNLYKIEFSDKAYEGVGYRAVELYLKDGNDVYILRSSGSKFSNHMRTLLNKLLTLTNFNNIEIGVFGKKDDYKNIYIKSNDQKVDFMFSKEETSILVEEIKDKKGNTIQRDYSDLDGMLENKVKEIIYPILGTKEDAVVDDKPEEESGLTPDYSNPFAKEETKEEFSINPDAEENESPF